jgi:hypothetical protein
MSQSDADPGPIKVGRARSQEILAETEIPFALVVAGLVYPLLASFCLAIWVIVDQSFNWGRSVRDPSDWGPLLWDAATRLFTFLAAGGLIAIPCVASMWILGSLTWVAGRAAVALFRGEISLVRFEGYVVGWAAFFLTFAGAWAFRPVAFGSVNPDFVLWLVLGPGLATPVGQFAGVFSSLALDRAPLGTPPLQFNIRGLLVVTLMVAVTLGVLKLLDLLDPFWLGLFAGWLVYQYITLQLVVGLFAWRLKKRRTKQQGQLD